MTPRQSKRQARIECEARIARAQAETAAVIQTGHCPRCDSGLHRNLALKGWWQVRAVRGRALPGTPERAGAASGRGLRHEHRFPGHSWIGWSSSRHRHRASPSPIGPDVEVGAVGASVSGNHAARREVKKWTTGDSGSVAPRPGGRFSR